LGKSREQKEDRANDRPVAKPDSEPGPEEATGSCPPATTPGAAASASGWKPARERLHPCPRSPPATALQAAHPPGAAVRKNESEGSGPSHDGASAHDRLPGFHAGEYTEPRRSSRAGKQSRQLCRNGPLRTILLKAHPESKAFDVSIPRLDSRAPANPGYNGRLTSQRGVSLPSRIQSTKERKEWVHKKPKR